MSQLFERLTARLVAVPWTIPWAKAHYHVEQILATEWKNRKRLLWALRGHIEGMAIPQITRTAELHSWLLYESEAWCLKLNQLMPSPYTGKQSENVHDHTRPLSSLTLAGGYTQDYYDTNVLRGRFQLGDRFCNEALPAVAGPATAPGTIYTIGPDIFHALTDFQDGTLTLCVYGLIVKDAITVFNRVSGRVERRFTCRCAKKMMLQQLRELEGAQ